VRKSGSNSSERFHRFGFAEMLRDVLVVSIERGQFLSAMPGLIAMLIVLKLPAELMSALIVRLLDSFERGCIWGYLAAVVLAASWIVHWYRRRLVPENPN
jgi:hypothetical protein